MLLVIGFNGELTPFILHDSDDAVLRAVEKAKEMFHLNLTTIEVRDDFVSLQAIGEKKPKKTQRLYVFRDRILLQTPCDCPDEKEPTRELLAYENGVSPEEIYIAEV